MHRAAVVSLAILLALAPAATAHTTVVSGDGKVRIVVGQLDEPVVTHQKTGLDLCFTQNNTARTPLSIHPGDFESPTGRVVLRSPSGQELAQSLHSQPGRAGCYQFADPYLLTEPGQYVVDLKGIVNGTAVAFTALAAGEAVQDSGTLAFPDDLDADQQAFSQDLDALAVRVADLEAANQTKPSEFAPGASVALLVGVVALAARLRRRD